MTKQLTLKVKREVTERATPANSNIPVCEGQGCNVIAGLQYHHEPPKGIGGSKRHYTKENTFYLCEHCHLVVRHGRGDKSVLGKEDVFGVGSRTIKGSV